MSAFHSNHKGFEFTQDNFDEATAVCARYPKKASALLPLLMLAQKQEGWLPKEALDYVAGFLELRPMHVYEVASFYTLFHLKKKGKHHIQVCRTTPCMLRNSEGIKQKIQDILKIELGGITADELFSLEEVECLGACVDAPVVQINDDYYEDLTPEKIADILHQLSEQSRSS